MDRKRNRLGPDNQIGENTQKSHLNQVGEVSSLCAQHRDPCQLISTPSSFQDPDCTPVGLSVGAGAQLISLKNQMQQELASSFTLETRSEYPNGGTSLRRPHQVIKQSAQPPGFGDLDILSQKSPWHRAGRGPLQLSPTLPAASRWAQRLGFPCYSAWKLFPPIFFRGQIM